MSVIYSDLNQAMADLFDPDLTRYVEVVSSELKNQLIVGSNISYVARLDALVDLKKVFGIPDTYKLWYFVDDPNILSIMATKQNAKIVQAKNEAREGETPSFVPQVVQMENILIGYERDPRRLEHHVLVGAAYFNVKEDMREQAVRILDGCTEFFEKDVQIDGPKAFKPLIYVRENVGSQSLDEAV